jgi:hypothetical protein
VTRSTYNALPVFLALVLLIGLGIESFARPRATDAEPFHRHVASIAKNLPETFGDWKSKEEEVTQSAVQLLRPNVIIQRRYWNSVTGDHASFLVVQCKDARDLGGHYPPNCYPAQGYTKNGVVDHDWTVGGRRLIGREYTFTRTEGLRTQVIHVASLLVLPDVGFVRDIDDVRSAASSFLRQFYGAAQIQVVCDDSMTAEARGRIFRELIEANMPIVDALRRADSQ